VEYGLYFRGKKPSRENKDQARACHSSEKSALINMDVFTPNPGYGAESAIPTLNQRRIHGKKRNPITPTIK